MRVACYGLLLALLPFLAADWSSTTQRYAFDTIVEADSRAVQTLHVEIAVPTDEAAQGKVEQDLTYGEEMEHVVLVEGTTVKPDDRCIPVPSSAVRVQPAQDTSSRPAYTGRKQVVATMPGAAHGDRLLGPAGWRDIAATEPTPCYAGEQEEALSLALPPGYHVAKLPSGREIAHEAFAYESLWTEEKGMVRVTRRFTSRIAQPLCEGPLRAAAAMALDEIKRDQAVQITLERD